MSGFPCFPPGAGPARSNSLFLPYQKTSSIIPLFFRYDKRSKNKNSNLPPRL